EQLALRKTVYTTTCILLAGGERPTDGVVAWHRGCVVRNCVVNGELLENPIDIESISVSGTTATITTKTAHGRDNDAWIVISGAFEAGQPSPNFNGSFKIQRVNDTQLTLTLRSPGPTSPPSGAMSIGRLSSTDLLRLISDISKVSGTTNTWLIT